MPLHPSADRVPSLCSGENTYLVIEFLRFAREKNSSGKENSLVTPASGRNDSVHAQVLDHLPVVIKCMGDGTDNQLETGSFIIPERQHLHDVFRSQGGGRLVTDGE